MPQAEFPGNPCAKRLNTEALGGVVARREIGDPELTRLVIGLLGNLTTDERVIARGSGLFDVSLRGSGTPGQAPDLTLSSQQ